MPSPLPAQISSSAGAPVPPVPSPWTNTCAGSQPPPARMQRRSGGRPAASMMSTVSSMLAHAVFEDSLEKLARRGQTAGLTGMSILSFSAPQLAICVHGTTKEVPTFGMPKCGRSAQPVRSSLPNRGSYSACRRKMYQAMRCFRPCAYLGEPWYWNLDLTCQLHQQSRSSSARLSIKLLINRRDDLRRHNVAAALLPLLSSAVQIEGQNAQRCYARPFDAAVRAQDVRKATATLQGISRGCLGHPAGKARCDSRCRRCCLSRRLHEGLRNAGSPTHEHAIGSIDAGPNA
mmetsp:Transcript_148012/g.475252  ORF Transcript_148012/g.475252 Transcript_148012/m.475252 type:complete len:289 (+) Transcript_148012:541-1407(+)